MKSRIKYGWTAVAAAQLSTNQDKFLGNSPYCNIDKFVLTCTSPSGIMEIDDNYIDPSTIIYNVYGIPVDDSYKGIVIVNGKKMLKK